MTPQEETPPAKRLTRSGSDRRLAGVAGGIARHFELDPSLVRIGFVVLSVFGGVGLALYALCAVVVPADEGAPPVTGTAKFGIVAIVVLALLAFPFAGPGSAVLLVVAAVGILVWRAVGGEPDERLVKASIVVVATAGALAVGIGAGIAAAFGAETAVAVLVVLAGVALVVGGLRGGARWLIVPALLLALPVSVVAAADLELEGGVGEREYRPGSVADIRDAYRLGAGDLVIDLRDVDFEDTASLAFTARVGMGMIEVKAPPGVCVQAEAHAGLGDIDLLGRNAEGVDVDTAIGGPASAGTPTLRMDLNAGMGEIVVDRAGPDRDGCA